MRSVRAALAAVISICCLLAASPDAHARGPFSKLVVFGDSLSDTGNFFAVTGSPPFPYFDGRASNGILWTEHLSEKLRVPLHPEDDYAWFGAFTGDGNLNDMPAIGAFFPGFNQQLEFFLADNAATGADPDALYTIWVGPNDFFAWLRAQNQTPEQLIASGVGNTILGIVTLASQGGRHFVVGNVPDLGLTPFAGELGPEAAFLLTQLSAAYNAALEGQLAALEENLGICITRLDAFAIINQAVADPAAFGFTNVTDQAIASFPASDPDGFLFWDGVHPTTATHERVADTVCAGLLETYAPPKARGKGPQSVPALNGLVRAKSNR